MSSDKVYALVTGGSRGIGYASAEALARDGYGLILADIDGDGLGSAVDRLGGSGEVLSYDVDMTDSGGVDAMFADIESRGLELGVLVNNAGMALPCDFLEVELSDFRRVIDLNLVSVFQATQSAARLMVSRGTRGSIVNLSSINAVVSIPSVASYCSSKGGVMQLTKSASLALAPHGIRVNAVGPGSIDTAMLKGINSDDAAMARVMSRTPLGRLGEASEIGDVVAFLASDKASYITGETIYIDGGRLGLNYTC